MCRVSVAAAGEVVGPPRHVPHDAVKVFMSVKSIGGGYCGLLTESYYAYCPMLDDMSSPS